MLLYRLAYPGNTEKAYAKQVYRAQGKIPERIRNAPKLSSGLQIYLTAFFALHRERDHGFNGPLRIKQRDITEYADRMNFDDDQRLRASDLIPQLDDAYLKDRAAKQPKAKPPKRR